MTGSVSALPALGWQAAAGSGSPTGDVTCAWIGENISGTNIPANSFIVGFDTTTSPHTITINTTIATAIPATTVLTGVAGNEALGSSLTAGNQNSTTPFGANSINGVNGVVVRTIGLGQGAVCPGFIKDGSYVINQNTNITGTWIILLQHKSGTAVSTLTPATTVSFPGPYNSPLSSSGSLYVEGANIILARNSQATICGNQSGNGLGVHSGVSGGIYLTDNVIDEWGLWTDYGRYGGIGASTHLGDGALRIKAGGNYIGKPTGGQYQYNGFLYSVSGSSIDTCTSTVVSQQNDNFNQNSLLGYQYGQYPYSIPVTTGSYSYKNKYGFNLLVTVTGGTLTGNILITRNGSSTPIDTGKLTGSFSLGSGDTLTINSSAVPTITAQMSISNVSHAPMTM